MIAVDNLIYGHALSVSNQPHLRSLIRAVRFSSKPLLIVAGAGVSMDAGLDSWTGLVGRLIDRCGRDAARRIRALEAPNPQRQAQVAKSLVLGQGSHRRRERQVRWGQILAEALYGGAALQPGLVAEAIARLVSVHRDARIVTTNFDRVLEVALENVSGRPVRSLALHDAEQWMTDQASPAQSVLHLHGVVDRQGVSKEPIVLTESDFHEHGSAVQSTLAGLVAGRLVIFVGVSMTDPNLVGPLSKLSRNREEHYVILVPRRAATAGQSEALDVGECAKFAVDQAEMLQEMLGVRPILLKTYAQVPQVISELALARRMTASYRRSSGAATNGLDYGERFAAALSSWYTVLGADPRTGDMSLDAAAALTTRFQQCVEAPGGPAEFLSQRVDPRRDGRDERVDDVSAGGGGDAPRERLAYYLWLREPPQRSADLVRNQRTDFRLRLMSSDIYVHLASWARERHERIDAESPLVAVHAMQLGRPVAGEFPPRGRTGWRSALAVPLMQSGYRCKQTVGDYYLDRLLLGVVSVNSTRPITSVDATATSVLAALTVDEMQLFQAALRATVENLLTPRE